MKVASAINSKWTKITLEKIKSMEPILSAIRSFEVNGERAPESHNKNNGPYGDYPGSS